MPDGLSFPDQQMFIALRHLYSDKRSGRITRDMAVREKKKLLESYRYSLFQQELGDRWTRMLKETEVARANFRKNRTIESAEILAKTIEGGI